MEQGHVAWVHTVCGLELGLGGERVGVGVSLVLIVKVMRRDPPHEATGGILGQCLACAKPCKLALTPRRDTGE